MSSQLILPALVRPEEIARKGTLGAAIELCANAGGYDLDKQLQQELGVDKAQFSRWQSGAEGIVWPKLENLMDRCGNDIPVLAAVGHPVAVVQLMGKLRMNSFCRSVSG